MVICGVVRSFIWPWYCTTTVNWLLLLADAVWYNSETLKSPKRHDETLLAGEWNEDLINIREQNERHHWTAHEPIDRPCTQTNQSPQP